VVLFHKGKKIFSVHQTNVLQIDYFWRTAPDTSDLFEPT